MALCCGAGMAATVAIDLNGEAAEGTSLPTNLKLSGFGDVNSGNVITAQKVVTWLQGTTGWQGTTANGNSGYGIYGSVTASGDTDVSVSFINRNACGGSIVGTAVTLTSDYASYTGLTLSVDCAGLQSGANFTTLNIVYQTAEGWQISQLTGQASSLIQTGMTLSVDLSGTPLTSDTAYIVMSTRNGGGNTNSNLLFSMSATAEDVVPEPATASLSLLGLSLLMLRRKR